MNPSRKPEGLFLMGLQEGCGLLSPLCVYVCVSLCTWVSEDVRLCTAHLSASGCTDCVWLSNNWVRSTSKTHTVWAQPEDRAHTRISKASDGPQGPLSFQSCHFLFLVCASVISFAWHFLSLCLLFSLVSSSHLLTDTHEYFMCKCDFPQATHSLGKHRRNHLLLLWTNCCVTSVCRKREMWEGYLSREEMSLSYISLSAICISQMCPKPCLIRRRTWMWGRYDQFNLFSFIF